MGNEEWGRDAPRLHGRSLRSRGQGTAVGCTIGCVRVPSPASAAPRESEEP